MKSRIIIHLFSKHKISHAIIEELHIDPISTASITTTYIDSTQLYF